MIISVFVSNVLIFCCVYGQPSPSETYVNSVTLKSGAFTLYWKFSDSDITFEIHTNTSGWVGLGVSENANMIGADITMGWVKNGNVMIQDMSGGTSNGPPSKDSQQDVNLLYGNECDGWTVIKFLRQLGACESSSDREITSSTTRVIWAYGTADPSGNDITAADVHLSDNKGSQSLYLLETQARRSLPSGKTYETFNLTANNFGIPASDTYYNCILFKLDLAQKHHIVKVSPIISANNDDYVHHMIVYSCGRSVPDESELGVNHVCFGSNMAYVSSCSTLMAAWAIGGSEIVYSEIAGLPIGGSDHPIYFQLETHYDNPKSLSTLTDSSGLMLTYTSDLMANDLGIIQIGNDVNNAYNYIPPGASEFLSVGMCGGTCLSDAMSSASTNSLNVVAGILHSHLVGRKMKLRQIRGGTELEPIYDDAYDFNYQEIRVIDPERQILPGDSFRMECNYNTENKTRMTLSGLGTAEEMCLSFIFYYPKVDVAICRSREDTSTTYAYFGIQSFTTAHPSIYGHIVTAPAGLNGKTVGQVMDEFGWNQARAEELSNVMQGSTHVQTCQKDVLSDTTYSSLNLPEIRTEYVISSKTCTSSTASYQQSKAVDACSGYRTGSNFITISALFVFAILL